MEKLIDRSKGDTNCDYRNSDEALASKTQEALKITCHHKVEYALDSLSDNAKGSYPNILKVLDPKDQICLIQNYDLKDMPESITHTRATVRWVHQNINTYAGMSSGPEEIPNLTDSVTGCRDFGYVKYRFFGQALEKGFLKGHPHKVVVGGLWVSRLRLMTLSLDRLVA